MLFYFANSRRCIALNLGAANEDAHRLELWEAAPGVDQRHELPRVGELQHALRGDAADLLAAELDPVPYSPSQSGVDLEGGEPGGGEPGGHARLERRPELPP